MSAALVSDPTVPQTFVDDLESAFYVILWLVLMYTDSSMTARERTTVMQHVMDPQPVEGTGGHGKEDFLQGQGVLRKLTLENPDRSRLKTLLVDLATLFSVRYEAEPTLNDWDLLDWLNDVKRQKIPGRSILDFSYGSRISELAFFPVLHRQAHQVDPNHLGWALPHSELKIKLPNQRGAF